MPLDVLQHGPLLVIPVVSSLSVGLELLHSGGGGSTGADPVHRGRDPLAEPRLDGPYLAEDLEEHRLHALVYAARRWHDAVRTWRLYLCVLRGGAAVSHGGGRETGGRQEEGSQLVDRWEQLQEHCEPGLYRRRIKPRPGRVSES